MLQALNGRVTARMLHDTSSLSIFFKLSLLKILQNTHGTVFRVFQKRNSREEQQKCRQVLRHFGEGYMIQWWS